MSIVIVYGSQNIGKSRRGDQLMKHYGCKRLVDEWDGRQKLRDGDLAITNMMPPFSVAGARIVDFITAKSAICP